MTDYTPTTAEVRGDYAHFQVPGGTDPVTGEFAEGLAEFDRWLAEYTRVKQAEALEEFAEKWATADGMEALMLATNAEEAVMATERELLARAAEYLTGGTK